jgi:hypothetical protein
MKFTDARRNPNPVIPFLDAFQKANSNMTCNFCHVRPLIFPFSRKYQRPNYVAALDEIYYTDGKVKRKCASVLN